MSDTTLIQRLRNSQIRGIYSHIDKLLFDASDALEQQAAQIAEKDAEIAADRRNQQAYLDTLADAQKQIEALRADAERLMAVTEETANMLRGMCMDPRIQKDIKEALWSRVRKLDKATEDVIDAALRQEQEGTNG